MDLEKLREAASQLKIGNYARHVFLCIGESCCSSEAGELAWKALKDQLKNVGFRYPQVQRLAIGRK